MGGGVIMMMMHAYCQSVLVRIIVICLVGSKTKTPQGSLKETGKMTREH